MGSQLYRCFACNGEPFHGSGSGPSTFTWVGGSRQERPTISPSCPKCESSDAVAHIVEIHMISEVKGGPINNKYKPLCCNTRPRYFTNSEGGVTCLICLEIIRKTEVEKVEEVEAASEQTPAEPAPKSIQELGNEYGLSGLEELDDEEDNPPCREC